MSSPLSTPAMDYEAEIAKLAKLYADARIQGNKKKKQEYKLKLSELRREHKHAQREAKRR